MKFVAYLRDLGSQVNVLLGVLQEVDKLHDFQFGLLTAGDIPAAETETRMNGLHWVVAKVCRTKQHIIFCSNQYQQRKN